MLSFACGTRDKVHYARPLRRSQGSHPKSKLCYHNYDNILIAQGGKLNIRPVSDLRNHYPDVEREVEQEVRFLTKNGRGSMVVMSFEQYKSLSNTIESALDAADRQAASNTFAIHTTMSLALSEKCSTAVSMNRPYKLRYLPLF